MDILKCLAICLRVNNVIFNCRFCRDGGDNRGLFTLRNFMFAVSSRHLWGYIVNNCYYYVLSVSRMNFQDMCQILPWGGVFFLTFWNFTFDSFSSSCSGYCTSYSSDEWWRSKNWKHSQLIRKEVREYSLFILLHAVLFSLHKYQMFNVKCEKID